MTRITVSLTVAGSLLLGGALQAQMLPPPPPPPPTPSAPTTPGPGMRSTPFRFDLPLGYMARFTYNLLMSSKAELGITDTQAAKLQEINTRSSAAPLQPMAVNELQREIRELASVDKPDMAKIEAKVREMEKLRSEEMLRDIRLNSEYRAVLTPEQREKLKTLSVRPPRMPGSGFAPGAPPPPVPPVPPAPPAPQP